MKLLKDIEKVTRQKIPASDRRNDKQLAQLDATIMATGVGKKASIDSAGKSEHQGRGGRGGRNPRRDGVKLEGGGQPHRVRKGAAAQGRPTPERTYDPMSGERPRTVNNDPRQPSTRIEPKPVDQLNRRPRRRRPSNGGKGYGSQKG